MNGTTPIVTATDEAPVTPSRYPESDKLSEVAPYSQKIGEFIDWLASEKNAYLAHDVEVPGAFMSQVYAAPLSIPVQTLLAEFFGIDEVKLEQERRAMLDALRAAQQ